MCAGAMQHTGPLAGATAPLSTGLLAAAEHCVPGSGTCRRNDGGSQQLPSLQSVDG